MLISRNTPSEGIFFAIWPRRTPEGLVALEWLHYRFIDSGFGGWEYARWVPEEFYADGERRKFNRNVAGTACPEEPLHCTYPDCACGDVGGSRCPETGP